jgi:predicted RNase H-like nuclease (RuvC/YqgF family)
MPIKQEVPYSECQPASQPASQEPILAQLTSMTASLQAMTSEFAAMKAGNDEMKVQLSKQDKTHKTLVTRVENISESMVVSAEVSNDITAMVTSMKTLMTEMAKDVQRNRFDRKAQMSAGLAKLQRYVKCDKLTQAFQAFMACIGVRRGIAVMALDAIALDREGTQEDKGDHAYQICLTTLFTYNVLGHFTQGGPK